MKYLLLVIVGILAITCKHPSADRDSVLKDFENQNLRGSRFGLGEKELILTLDDGPSSPYTLQIADYLLKQNVPAVFFMVGANA